MGTAYKENSKVYNSCEEDKDVPDGLAEAAVLLHQHFDKKGQTSSKSFRQSLLQFFGVVLILLLVTVVTSLIEYFFIRITGEEMNNTVNEVEVFLQYIMTNESMNFETTPRY